jgi:hypothetical protein
MGSRAPYERSAGAANWRRAQYVGCQCMAVKVDSKVQIKLED